jgi:hypothetical protein
LLASSVRKVEAPPKPLPEPKGKLYVVRALVCAFTADAAGLLITSVITQKIRSTAASVFLFALTAGPLAALLGRAFTERRRRDNALLAVAIALGIPLLIWILRKL